MIDPQLIFQNPDMYIAYMQSANPEGQSFDRKEVRNSEKKDMSDARENIIECVSAFSNSHGGITVLGISNTGEMIGLNHLKEQEYISLTKSINEKLANHFSQIKEWNYEGKKMLLIYTPVGRTGICSTIGDHSKAWIRNSADNAPMTAEQKERIILDRSGNFEQLAVCDYDRFLLNDDILALFKRRYLEEQGSKMIYDNERFLNVIGAIRMENNKQVFTNAGILFFGINPGGNMPAAHIRIIKYDVDYINFESRGNPIFDRTYDGCLPVLLQKIRTFLKEAAFFKTYTYRDISGTGIIDEPEFPLEAIEETIVNAIIHRDYSIPVPIECTLFKDSFVVRSPGKFRQPEYIPTEFTLENQNLAHYPRNPAIVQWAKTMKDTDGQKFVKALSEGYRTLRDSMKNLQLPAPKYRNNGFTTVILYNNYEARESKIKKLALQLDDEYANLFELKIEGDHNNIEENKGFKAVLLGLIKDKLASQGWFIDKQAYSRFTAHQKGKSLMQNGKVDEIVKFFPSYRFQIHYINYNYYLSIDYDLQVKNSLTIAKLLTKGLTDFVGKKALARVEGNTWANGIIQSTDDYYTTIQFYDYDKSMQIPHKYIIPNLTKSEIKKILNKVDKNFDIDFKIKSLSLATSLNGSRERWDKIETTVSYIAKEIFPINQHGLTAYIGQRPLLLNSSKGISVHHNIKEPEVKFADNSTAPNIASGLTKYGSFSHDRREVEIVPFCISGYGSKMENLLSSLKQGSQLFRGMERTFKVKATYRAIIEKDSAETFLDECKRLLADNPGWIGDSKLPRIFLIHIPEEIYPSTDINSPYYSIKEFLLQNGIPVQMVDTNTINDPRYKDLNLSLNIVAKTGGTPWILPNALPEADCFIGLSYAQYQDANKLVRTMGYANVFTSYGEWQYFKGNSATFNFQDKHIHLANLVVESINQRSDLPPSAIIHIHYTNKFSNEDIKHITNEVLKIKPKASINFVWINTDHNVRMFDPRLEGNGSLSRGTFVITGDKQFYLSTTGYSVLRKTLGTPVLLEVNTRTQPVTTSPANHKAIAQHLLSLSKLNWAGTQSVNAEPVTTKYAHDIARLSSAFYRRKGAFKLHSVLEKTPWFI